MGEKLETRKVVLLSLGDASLRSRIEFVILKHFPGTTVFHAADGSEAWAKMGNVPPHVLILERSLSKIDGLQLVKNMLGQRAFEATAAIFLDSPPEMETFVDEIVTGRVQFMGDKTEESGLTRALVRALNDVSSREETEFHLRFLVSGDQLLHEGDRTRNVYLVKRGRLQACHRHASGETILGEVEAGEFVGEMAYINNEPRSADVFALTECELIEIPVGLLDHELYRKPSWAKALMVTLSKRVKRANAHKS